MATDISDLMQRIEKSVDFLSTDELKKLHGEMEKKGFIDSDLEEDPNAIKEALQKISIEDLEQIAPSAIKMLISELTAEEEEAASVNIEIQSKSQTTDETEESLILEATQILNQRPKAGAEIPKDLQPRVAYIFAKLHNKFSLSFREIERRIDLSRQTISNYEERYAEEQPDTIRMWIQSVESKVFSKVEETIGKQAAARTIATLKENITIGDMVREKFAAAAYVRGYDLYIAKDFERLIYKALNLFFEIDGIFQSIIDTERENQKLRNNIQVLKKRNSYLNTLVYERNFLEGE